MVYLPLLQKGFVYIFGFVSVVALSAIMDSDDFGRYAIYQSVIEFSCVLCTLGCGVLYSSRSAITGRFIGYKELASTLAWGFPFSILAIFLFGCFFDLQILEGFVLFLVSGLYVLLSSFVQLIVSADKFCDRGFKANTEPIFRALLITILSGGVFWLFGFVSYSAVVIVVFFVSLILAAWVAVTRRVDFEFCQEKIKLSEKINVFVYSVSNFFVKKFDVIAIGLVSSFTFVGYFKLVFLMVEAPMQFLIAYLNSISARLSRGGDSLKEIANQVRLILGGVALALACVGMSCYFYDLTFRKSLFPCFNILFGYFFVRAYTTILDFILSQSGAAGRARFYIFSLALIKYLLILIIGFYSDDFLIVAYWSLAVIDFIVFEFVFYKVFNKFAFREILEASKLHG